MDRRIDDLNDVDELFARRSADYSKAPKILIVDGVITELDPRTLSLKSQGFRTSFGRDSQEGLSLAGLFRPDLILLGFNLPDMAAAEFCRCLEAKSQTSGIPVIFMISEDQIELLPPAFAAGGADFVYRQARADELLMRIHLRIKLGSGKPIQRMPISPDTPGESALNEVAASATAGLSRRQSDKTLVKSWLFLNRVIDTIADPIFVKDRQGRWILLNQAFCEFIGHPLQALLGKTDTDFFPAHEAAVFRANDESVFNSGNEDVNEEAFTDREGITHTIVTKKTCYTDEAGQKVLVGVIRDISERKRLEAQFAKQAQELRTLIEHAPDSIIRYDRETRVSYVNPQLLQTMNQPLQEILDKRADERLANSHPAMQGYLSVLKRVIETGQPEEYLLEMEAGYFSRAVYDNIRFAPEFSSDGKQVCGVIAIGRNYARQRQLELELARREREFRTLAENSPDIIVRYDKDCRRTYANRAYMVSLAASARDVLGKTPLEFWRVSSPSALEYMDILKRILTTGRMEEIQVESLGLNGQNTHFAMYLVPECDHCGQINSVLSISRDITELKAVEQRLEESRAQLRALTAQREETREDERKRIARELHDELGQRLTALRMDISRLRLRFGHNNPALLEQVWEMVASVDATIQVVRDVAAALRPAVLDMGIVAALEWLADDFVKRSGIACELQIPSSRISMDDTYSTALFRIVQESLTNVVRHAQASKVRVLLLRHDHGYELEVRDNGVGFDLQARKNKGSFGLIGIEERVLMLGGSLHVDASPGKGVKLCVRLDDAGTS